MILLPPHYLLSFHLALALGSGFPEARVSVVDGKGELLSGAQVKVLNGCVTANPVDRSQFVVDSSDSAITDGKGEAAFAKRELEKVGMFRGNCYRVAEVFYVPPDCQEASYRARECLKLLDQSKMSHLAGKKKLGSDVTKISLEPMPIGADNWPPPGPWAGKKDGVPAFLCAAGWKEYREPPEVRQAVDACSNLIKPIANTRWVQNPRFLIDKDGEVVGWKVFDHYEWANERILQAGKAEMKGPYVDCLHKKLGARKLKFPANGRAYVTC